MSHLDVPAEATLHGEYHAATDEQRGNPQLSARAKEIWLRETAGSGRDWAKVRPGPEDGVLVYVTDDRSSPKVRLVVERVDATGKLTGDVVVSHGTTPTPA